jgi:hypothetical protein
MEIPDHEAEEYSFLRLYSIDLDQSRQAVALLRSVAEEQLRHALFRDAVLSYCRPFSGNRRRDGTQHRLSVRKYVPKDMRSLHHELSGLRRQVFAHTDILFLRPQLSHWPRTGGKPVYGMAFRIPPYGVLLARLEECSALVVTVENSINDAVRTAEDRFERLYCDEANPFPPGV